LFTSSLLFVDLIYLIIS